MKTLLLVLLSVACSACGQLFLRSGARAAVSIAGSTAWELATWVSLFSRWQVMAGIAAWAVSTLLWLVVLNRTELTWAYGFTALNYVFVPLLSRWLLEERLPPARIVGMIFICTGVLITWLGRGSRP